MGNVQWRNIPCIPYIEAPDERCPPRADFAAESSIGIHTLHAEIKTLEAMITNLTMENRQSLQLLRRQGDEVSDLRSTLSDLRVGGVPGVSAGPSEADFRAYSVDRPNFEKPVAASSRNSARFEEVRSASSSRIPSSSSALQQRYEENYFKDSPNASPERKSSASDKENIAAMEQDLTTYLEQESAAEVGSVDGAQSFESTAEEEERKAIFETASKEHEHKIRTFSFGAGTIGLSFSSFSVLDEQNQEMNVTKPAGSSILVTAVVPGGAAEGLGVRSGDLITSFNGRELPESMTKDEFFDILADSPRPVMIGFRFVTQRN